MGKTIAVIAEPDDDLATLKLPEPVIGFSTAAPTPEPAAAPKVEEPIVEEPKVEVTKSEQSKAPSGSNKADPKQTLFPSVFSLALSNNLTAEEVLANVPASGPKNRVTKGDLLAYLGKIAQAKVDALTAEIKKLGHLDLTHIKAKKADAAPVAASKAEETKAEEAKPAKAAPPPPVVLTGMFTLAELESLQISLEDSVGTAPTLQQLVDKASKLAMKDIPAYSKAKKSILNDPAFESILAPSNKGLKPFEVSIVFPEVPKKKQAFGKVDIYDILGSKKKPTTARVSVSDTLTASVTVNPKYIGGEKKAQIYLERLGFYLSAGRGELLL